MDGVILHDFEREKASAERDKSEHHQGDRVSKQRFARAFAAALPTLRKEQHTADGIDCNATNRQDRPRQIPLHLSSTSLHISSNIAA